MPMTTADPVLDEGRYAVRDRRTPTRTRIQVYRVTHTPDGTDIHAEYGRSRRGKLVARWTTGGDLVPTGDQTARQSTLVTELLAAPHDARALYARTTGRCGRCNRRLTRADSIAAGLGPECRQQKTTRAA